MDSIFSYIVPSLQCCVFNQLFEQRTSLPFLFKLCICLIYFYICNHGQKLYMVFCTPSQEHRNKTAVCSRKVSCLLFTYSHLSISVIFLLRRKVKSDLLLNGKIFISHYYKEHGCLNFDS